MWSLTAGGLYRQVLKHVNCFQGSHKKWSLWTGGPYIQVVAKAGLTVLQKYFRCVLIFLKTLECLVTF